MEPSLLNKVDNSADVDLSIVKVISFMAAAVISAGVAGYFIAKADFVYGLLSLIIFWVIFVLQVMFIKDWTRIFLLIFLESVAMTLAPAIIFRDNFSGFIFLAFGALFGLLLLAENAGRSELVNSLKIPLWKVIRHSASKVIPTTLTFIAIVYLFVAGKSIIQTEGVKFANEAVVTPAVRTIIPEFMPGMSLEDVLGQILKKQIGETAYNNLSPAQKTQAINNAKQGLTNYIGDIDSKAPLGNAIYSYFSVKLTSAPFPVKATIGLVLVFIIFGLVKMIGLILYIPVAALAVFFYEILIVLNFVVIQYESRSREIILLK